MTRNWTEEPWSLVEGDCELEIQDSREYRVARWPLPTNGERQRAERIVSDHNALAGRNPEKLGEYIAAAIHLRNTFVRAETDMNVSAVEVLEAVKSFDAGRRAFEGEGDGK